MRYASDPVRVQFRPNIDVKGTAIRWYGDNIDAVTQFIGYLDRDEDNALVICDDDGTMSIHEGDWLIILDGVPGSPAPATSLFFDALFEPVP
jgi:hypothetical protein